MTRGLRTGCSVCKDTTISDDASAPNCRCSPATGGVATGSDDRLEGEAPASAPRVPIREAATTAPPPMPAAASSLRRLSSRLNSVSCVVIAVRLLHGGRESLSQVDDSWGMVRAVRTWLDTVAMSQRCQFQTSLPRTRASGVYTVLSCHRGLPKPPGRTGSMNAVGRHPLAFFCRIITQLRRLARCAHRRGSVWE